jgi:hypothetical protein
MSKHFNLSSDYEELQRKRAATVTKEKRNSPKLPGIRKDGTVRPTRDD